MLIEASGWAGAALILGCYLWITYRPASLRYHIVNFVSCILLIVNVVAHHATPSIFINLVWGVLAINGMWKEHCITRLTRLAEERAEEAKMWTRTHAGWLRKGSRCGNPFCAMPEHGHGCPPMDIDERMSDLSKGLLTLAQDPTLHPMLRRAYPFHDDV